MKHVFILLILMSLLSACAIGPNRLMPKDDSMAVQPNGVGIALAGGGSKAASYAMGVLAAIADDKKGFNLVNSISSVSGGGYSAFYLYSKLLVADENPEERLRPVKDFFDDCIPDYYEDVLPKPYNGFPPICTDKNYDKFRFQEFVRCRQDILENNCEKQLHRNDRGEYTAAIKGTGFLLNATGLMSPPSLVANSIFDWPINISPTRYAYKEGIGTAYGLYPKSVAAIVTTPDIMTICNDETFFNCDNKFGVAKVKQDDLIYNNLRKLTIAGAGSVPVWYINTTVSKDRSLYGWAQKGLRNFTQYTLQISPFDARSGYYGLMPEYEKSLDILGGVTASAAFLDSNETVENQPWRMTLAALQHITTLSWGTDISNPTVNPSWKILHSILPFPLYYIDYGLRRLGGGKDYQDSEYIHLLDGGNNDDLGAYTLFQKKMKHIIISDHSYDGGPVKDDNVIAKMKDVCLLQNEIALRSDSKLVIPGLQDLTQYCLSFIGESECCESSNKSKSCDSCKVTPSASKDNDKPQDIKKSEDGYPLLSWKHHVLLGCITSKNNKSNTCGGPEDIRVYVLKPAFDLENFMIDYLEPTPKGKLHVKQIACSDNKNTGLCEVAAYVADWYNHADKKSVIHPFPQDSTVAVTFASTGKIYGAYRELARWHMHEAIDMLNLTDNDFNKTLQDQGDKPIPRK
jgi:hypothetical protein